MGQRKRSAAALRAAGVAHMRALPQPSRATVPDLECAYRRVASGSIGRSRTAASRVLLGLAPVRGLDPPARRGARRAARRRTSRDRAERRGGVSVRRQVSAPFDRARTTSGSARWRRGHRSIFFKRGTAYAGYPWCVDVVRCDAASGNRVP